MAERTVKYLSIKYSMPEPLQASVAEYSMARNYRKKCWQIFWKNRSCLRCRTYLNSIKPENLQAQGSDYGGCSMYLFPIQKNLGFNHILALDTFIRERSWIQDAAPCCCREIANPSNYVIDLWQKHREKVFIW